MHFLKNDVLIFKKNFSVFKGGQIKMLDRQTWTLENLTQLVAFTLFLNGCQLLKKPNFTPLLSIFVLKVTKKQKYYYFHKATTLNVITLIT